MVKVWVSVLISSVSLLGCQTRYILILEGLPAAETEGESDKLKKGRAVVLKNCKHISAARFYR